MDIGSLVAAHRLEQNRAAFTMEELERAAVRPAFWTRWRTVFVRGLRRRVGRRPAHDPLASPVPAE